MVKILLRYLLALCAAMNKSSSPVLNSIQSNGVLRVGLTGDYAPYSFRTKDNSIIGADVIMAESLANFLGVRLEIISTTWKKLQEDLLANKFDIAMGGVSVNPRRSEVGHFSDPLISDGKRPIVRCEDQYKYTTVESLNQPTVRVIVNPGGTNHNFAKANLTKSSLTIFEDNRKIFKEIAENRADAMVTDGIEVELQSRLFPGVLCPAKVNELFTNFEKAYWMSKDDLFRERVNCWLRIAKRRVWPTALQQALSANYE